MEQEQMTYIPLSPTIRTHKHTWTQAINIEDEGLILFCECGATMDDDGIVIQ